MWKKSKHTLVFRFDLLLIYQLDLLQPPSSLYDLSHKSDIPLALFELSLKHNYHDIEKTDIYVESYHPIHEMERTEVPGNIYRLEVDESYDWLVLPENRGRVVLGLLNAC